MGSWLRNTATACSGALGRFYRPARNRDDGSGGEGRSLIGQEGVILWHRDLERHCFGDLSYAAVQSNETMEDSSHVEICRNSTYVGVYDGHGGPDASRHVATHLIPHLRELERGGEIMSGELITKAFTEMENAYAEIIETAFKTNPLTATSGSCCLVGVIRNEEFYIANLGDSRAVLGREERSQHCLHKSQRIFAIPLTVDHNVCNENIRQELQSLHPEDPGIVVQESNGAWLVEGIIQITRAFGDIYLKKPGFDLDSSHPQYHLPEPLRKAVLRSDPEITTRVLTPDDKFLIFASDGLWDLLSNQKAVEIVYNNPREGIARRLLKSALEMAASRGNMSYDKLKDVKRENRRNLYDDITVVVVYIDHESSDSLNGFALRAFGGPSS